MLVILMFTSLLALLSPETLLLSGPASASPETNSDDVSLKVSRTSQERSIACFRRFAVPQITLAILALTSFHVQIINRISTGYPVWYLVIAIIATSSKAAEELHKSVATYFQALCRNFSTTSTQQLIFRSMIMYAVVQGGLYASFLPPA